MRSSTRTRRRGSTASGPPCPFSRSSRSSPCSQPQDPHASTGRVDLKRVIDGDRADRVSLRRQLGWQNRAYGRRVLVTSPAGLGHIHPMVPLARAMVAVARSLVGGSG